MEENHQNQPLLLSKPTHHSSQSILLRLLTITLISLLSLYANHEASKGFEIKIQNQSSNINKRFNLLYISNDKAIRILQNASHFVEHLLYYDNHNDKKRIRRVTLRICHDDNATVIRSDNNEFVIGINVDRVMKEDDVDRAMVRGMARVWLWDGESTAPMWLVDGLVEYIGLLAGFGGCQNGRECGVVKMLEACEKREKGFIGRLNGALRDKWDHRTVDDLLGAMDLCEYPTKTKSFVL